ncbi:hypothetical protein B9Z55_005814 [Caenorhabditis nigoni]|uniref:NADAR domain-containing protein n=1 Tax=Caenorhabditis nigoni TaxID=1611254 RepID=A0A2G5V2H1_9PELO|nr:hypothetical protein B9Z55_005814 [Caenorhabditis nigoni]
MSYHNSLPWGSSYYDYNGSAGTPAGTWRSEDQYSQSPHEQYNPAYPSLNGTSNFFSSSAQDYEAAPYHPTSTSTTAQKSSRIPTQRHRRYENQRRGKKTWDNNRFHLVTINPNSGEKPTVAKIAEPAPIPADKVARGNPNTIQSPRGIGRNKNMPNYRLQGNGWETNGYQNHGGRGGRGRGRGGSHRGGRFHGPPKPSNNKDDIKYVHLPDDSPAVTLTVSSENILAFHGFDSVFTTQHNFPVLIDNKIYKSCDHYYQICKVVDLSGISSDKLNNDVRDENGKPILDAPVEKDKRAHSAIAKEILKTANVDKSKVDEWRNTKGLEAVQKALLAKASQSAHLREALKESGDQILVHAYPRDSIYGTGCGVPTIKKWLSDLEKSAVKTIRIPAEFPLNETTIQHCPVFAQGRNVLGVILMQLREKIRKGDIEVVDMTKIYDALRSTNASTEPMDTAPVTGYNSEINAVGTF